MPILLWIDLVCVTFCDMYFLSNTCPHLNTPNGFVTYNRQGQPPAPDGNWVIGTVATFHCNSGYFRIAGSSSRTCRISEDWSYPNARCRQSKLFNFVWCMFLVHSVAISLVIQIIILHSNARILLILQILILPPKRVILKTVISLQTAMWAYATLDWRVHKAGIRHTDIVKLILEFKHTDIDIENYTYWHWH